MDMAAKGRGLAFALVSAGAAMSSVLLHAQSAARHPTPAQPSPSAQHSGATQPPGQVQAPDPDPDQQFVETTCATCHPIAQVKAKHMSAEAWAVTVDKMIGLGAQVTSEEDRDRIIAWLAAHQAP